MCVPCPNEQQFALDAQILGALEGDVCDADHILTNQCTRDCQYQSFFVFRVSFSAFCVFRG